MDLVSFLGEMVGERASDVFFVAGLPVTYRTGGRQVRLGGDPLMPADPRPPSVRSSRRRAARGLGRRAGQPRPRLLVCPAGRGALPRERVPPARVARRRRARHPLRPARPGGVRHPRGGAAHGRPAEGAGARDRPRGRGQVHHARLHRGPHEPRALGPRDHDGGPHRVRAPARDLHRHAARGAHRRGHLRRGAPVRHARGARRDPARRDARHRDDLDRRDRGGDGAADLLDAAHHGRRRHRRPHRRRVSRQPAAPDPPAALHGAAGDRQPAARADRRRRRHAGVGDHGGHPRDPQPHPRGEDAPDRLRGRGGAATWG